MAEAVRIDIDGRGVATLCLSRAERLNALDQGLVAACNEALAGLADKAGVRVLVLKGAGKVFSAGADVAYLKAVGALPERENLADAEQYALVSRRLKDLPMPVVCRLNGGAYGGGVGFVAASDIAVAEEGATLAITEARFGFTPSVMLPYLIARIGYRQARRWCLTGEQMTATEAERIGLVDRVAAAGALDEAVEKIVEALLMNAPEALAQSKRAIIELARPRLDDRVIALTARAFADGRGGAEGQAGAAAFLAKRKPNWALE